MHGDIQSASDDTDCTNDDAAQKQNDRTPPVHSLTPPLFISHNPHLDRIQCGLNRWNSQHGSTLLPWRAFVHAPRIGPFGSGVPGHVEYLDVAFPNSLPLKDLFNRLRADMCGIALMQMPNHHLQSFNVFSIQHSVRQEISTHLRRSSSGFHEFAQPLCGLSPVDS